MINWDKLIEFVKDKHIGHHFAGFDHVERVYNLCVELSKDYDVDADVLKAAAYIHDIAVPMYGPSKHNERALEVAGDILREIGFPKEKDELVYSAIKSHTRYEDIKPESIEAKILKDADGIDYLGSIGILRGVARGLKNGSYTGNVSGEGTNLLNGLVDKVSGSFETKRGNDMAEDRIQFINSFMERLKVEIGNL